MKSLREQFIDVAREAYYWMFGSTRIVYCPFHKERTPSCCINMQTGVYHCFGCGRGGPINELPEDLR